MNLIFSPKTFLFLLFILLSANALKAQEITSSVAKVKVTSNYDSFYVLTGDSTESAKLRKSDEFFDIKSGVQKIWIVPPFSSPYSIQRNFIADSIHVIDIAFRSMLDKPSSAFLKIQSNDSTFNSLQNYKIESSNLTSSFRMYTSSDYQASLESDQNYNSTYLKINTNVDSLFIQTSSFEGTPKKIANGDSILVRPGFRTIIISHEKSNEFAIRRRLRQSVTTTVEHSFKLSDTSIEQLSDNIAIKPTYDANLIIVSDDDSEITVDGEPIGRGAVKLNMQTGPVDILVENKFTGLSSFSTKIFNLESDKAFILNAYTKPLHSKARLYSFVPGLSQVYKRQRIKGYAFSGSFLIAGYFTLQKHNQYQKDLTAFNNLERRYNESTNEQATLELGNQLERQHQIVVEKDNQRIAFFALTSAIYAFNIYDALFNKPDGGYRTKTDIDFYLNNEMVDSNRYTTLSLRYDF